MLFFIFNFNIFSISPSSFLVKHIENSLLNNQIHKQNDSEEEMEYFPLAQDFTFKINSLKNKIKISDEPSTSPLLSSKRIKLKNNSKKTYQKSLPFKAMLQTLSEKLKYEEKRNVCLPFVRYLLDPESPLPSLSQNDFLYERYIDSQTKDVQTTSFIEVISNAIDALSRSVQIGQFNRGVKQLLIHLRQEGDRIAVLSRAQGQPENEAFLMEIFMEQGLMKVSLKQSIRKSEGTTVTLEKTSSSLNPQLLRETLHSRYLNLSQATLIYNNDVIQDDFWNISYEELLERESDVINVSCSSHFFKCEDQGCGMNESELLSMFIPMISKKQSVSSKEEECAIYSDIKLNHIQNISHVSFSRFSEVLVTGSFDTNEGAHLIIELGSFLQTYESRHKIKMTKKSVDILVKLLFAIHTDKKINIHIIDSIYCCLKMHLEFDNSFEKDFTSYLRDSFSALIMNLLKETDSLIDKDLISIEDLIHNTSVFFVDKELIPPFLFEKGLNRIGAQHIGFVSINSKNTNLYTCPIPIQRGSLFDHLKNETPLPVYYSEDAILIPDFYEKKEGLWTQLAYSLFIFPFYEEELTTLCVFFFKQDIPPDETPLQLHSTYAAHIPATKEIHINLNLFLKSNERVIRCINHFCIISKVIKEGNDWIEVYQIRPVDLIFQEKALWLNSIVIEKDRYVCAKIYSHKEQKMFFAKFLLGDDVTLNLFKWSYYHINTYYQVFQRTPDGLYGISLIDDEPDESLCQWKDLVQLSQDSSLIKIISKKGTQVAQSLSHLKKENKRWLSIQESHPYLLLNNPLEGALYLLSSPQQGENDWIPFFSMPHTTIRYLGNNFFLYAKEPSLAQQPVCAVKRWLEPVEETDYKFKHSIVLCHGTAFIFQSARTSLWGVCALNECFDEKLCRFNIIFDAVVCKNQKKWLTTSKSIQKFGGLIQWGIIESNETDIEESRYCFSDIEIFSVPHSLGDYVFIVKGSFGERVGVFTDPEQIYKSRLRYSDARLFKNYVYLKNISDNRYKVLLWNQLNELDEVQEDFPYKSIHESCFKQTETQKKQTLSFGNWLIMENEATLSFAYLDAPSSDQITPQGVLPHSYLYPLFYRFDETDTLWESGGEGLGHLRYHSHSFLFVLSKYVITEKDKEIYRPVIQFLKQINLETYHERECLHIYENCFFHQISSLKKHLFISLSEWLDLLSYPWLLQTKDHFIDLMQSFILSLRLNRNLKQHRCIIYELLSKRTQDIDGMIKKMSSMPYSLFKKWGDSLENSISHSYFEFEKDFLDDECEIIIQYLTHDIEIPMNHNYRLPHQVLNPSIPITHLTPDKSIREHIENASNKTPSILWTATMDHFLQNEINHTSKGMYAREFIRNTKDGEGSTIQVSYYESIVQINGHPCKVLVEEFTDDSHGPDNLVYLLIPDFTTKKTSFDHFVFGRGSLLYMSDIDAVDYEVYNQFESCRIYIEGTTITRYEPLSHCKGRSGMTVRRLYKQNRDFPERSQLIVRECQYNWEQSSKGVVGHPLIYFNNKEGDKIILNQQYKEFINSDDLFETQPSVRVKILTPPSFLTKKSQGILIQDDYGLQVCFLKKGSESYRELFCGLPEQWQKVMHRDHLTFQIKAPMMRDRSFFSWTEDIKSELQRIVAISVCSYMAKRLFEDVNFVVPEIPWDIVCSNTYHFSWPLHSFFHISEEEKKFIFDLLNRFDQKRTLYLNLIKVIMRVPFLTDSHTLTTLREERRKVKSNMSLKPFGNQTTAIEEKHRMLDDYCLSTEESQMQFAIYFDILNRLKVTAQLFLYRDPYSLFNIHGAYNYLKNIIYIRKESLETPLGISFFCHELSHYYEYCLKTLDSDDSMLDERDTDLNWWLCGHMTHQRDGHFSKIYRWVAYEVYRLFIEIQNETKGELPFYQPVHSYQKDLLDIQLTLFA